MSNIDDKFDLRKIREQADKKEEKEYTFDNGASIAAFTCGQKNEAIAYRFDIEKFGEKLRAPLNYAINQLLKNKEMEIQKTLDGKEIAFIKWLYGDTSMIFGGGYQTYEGKTDSYKVAIITDDKAWKLLGEYDTELQASLAVMVAFVKHFVHNYENNPAAEFVDYEQKAKTQDK